MPAIAHRGKGRRTINEINMVPFIDVMLVLLIIFMVTAPLITPSMIDLPSVGKAARQPDQVIEIIVGKQDKLEWKWQQSTQPLRLNDVVSVITKAQKDSGIDSARFAVVISADKAVAYESVVKVMDKLQRGGIQRVGLSVQINSSN